MRLKNFRSWAETHHLIVTEIALLTDVEGSLPNRLRSEGGITALFDLSIKLTDDFERIYRDVEWDGEYFDTVESFLKINLVDSK